MKSAHRSQTLGARGSFRERGEARQTMQDIRSAIKAKRLAVARLQEELGVLERAFALLEGDTVVTDETFTGPPPPPRGALAKGYISPDSQVGQTVAVLREAGVPLHVTEIIKRIEQKGRSVKKTSLVGSLARLVNERRVLFRKKPNVYGLVEWKSGAYVAPTRRAENGGAGSAGEQPGSPDAVSKTTAGWSPHQH
jgi:hypothetical protein